MMTVSAGMEPIHTNTIRIPFYKLIS